MIPIRTGLPDTEGALRDRVRKLQTMAEREHDAYTDDPEKQAEAKARAMFELLELTNFNLSPLAPYFYPDYLNGKDPLSFVKNRAFTWDWFDCNVYGWDVFRGSRQISKEQPYSADVMTPTGWRKMGDLVVGDYVTGGDGKPARIADIAEQGVKDVYRVTFTDESVAECGWEHNWKVLKNRQGKAGNTWAVRTLQQIVERNGYTPDSDTAARIPLTGPVEMPKRKHHIHPYVLGAILGDGGCIAHVRMTSFDPPIIKRMQKLTPDGKYVQLTNRPGHFDLVTDRVGRVSPFLNELRRLNVLGKRGPDKRVPQEYLVDSVANRLEMLRGLMDTDGAIAGKCQISFGTSSPGLAQDVQYLAQSLGGTAEIVTYPSSYKDKTGKRVECRTCYKVNIRHLEMNPFFLPRKAKKVYTTKYARTRILKSVEKVRQENSRCLVLDSADHTYLTNEFIVTHNSTTMACKADMLASILPGFGALYVAPLPQQVKTFADRYKVTADLNRVRRAMGKPPPGLKENLYQRRYVNGSHIKMVACLTTAHATRGNSVDSINIDECFVLDTELLTPTGPVKLAQLSVGDALVSFCENGNLAESNIVGKVFKGVRSVWRITTHHGTQLTCTDNELLYTSDGWKYLSEIILHPECQVVGERGPVRDLGAARTDRRVVTWGRLSDQVYNATPAAALRARSCAKGLLLEQVRGAEGFCTNTAKGTSEPRVQGDVSYRDILDAGSTVLRQVPCTVHADGSCDGASEEVRLAGLGGRVDAGSSGLVVPGRRDETRGGDDVLHAPLQCGGSGASSEMVCGQRTECSCEDDEEARIRVPDTRDGHRVISEAVAVDRAVHAREHEVQAGDVSKSRVPVPALWCAVPRTVAGGAGSVLPSTGVSDCKESRTYRVQAGVVQDAGGGEPGLLQGAVRRLQEEAGIRSSSHGGVPGKLQPEEQGAIGGSCTQGGTERLEAGIQSESESTGTASYVMGLSDIVSVEYVGEQEVWDIEVEGTHTFFANGIAVHNCQNFDLNLENEILFTQQASKYPMLSYGGTALTTDTALETKFEESSRGFWHVLCPMGHWNNTGDVQTSLDMIQPDGLRCAHKGCGCMVDPMVGEWVHENMELYNLGFRGNHVSQIIVPDFILDAGKWNKIYERSRAKDLGGFMQEVLGIPTAEGAKEITSKELEAICVLNQAEIQAKAVNRGYKYVVSGCDWGGSDYNEQYRLKESYTVHAVIGVTANDDFDILHIKKYAGMGYSEIIENIVHNHVRLGGTFIASDYGVGQLYNEMIRKHVKIDPRKHFIMQYQGPKTKFMAKPVSSQMPNMLMLNKVESVTYTFQQVKDLRLKCYQWQLAQDCLLDFTAVIRAPQETESGAGHMVFRRHGSKPDDTLHAVNFATQMARLVMGDSMNVDPEVMVAMRAMAGVAVMHSGMGRRRTGTVAIPGF